MTVDIIFTHHASRGCGEMRSDKKRDGRVLGPQIEGFVVGLETSLSLGGPVGEQNVQIYRNTMVRDVVNP